MLSTTYEYTTLGECRSCAGEIRYAILSDKLALRICSGSCGLFGPDVMTRDESDAVPEAVAGEEVTEVKELPEGLILFCRRKRTARP